MKQAKKFLSLILSLAIVTSFSLPAVAAEKSISSNSIISIDYAGSDITYSPTVDGFVARLYNLALQRNYDQAGFDYWKNLLITGEKSASNVGRLFITSPEFIGLNYTNDQYVTVLYKVFLNRDPEAAGKTYWLNKMNAGETRNQILEGFIASTEWANICLKYGIVSGSGVPATEIKTPSAGVNTFVNSLYSSVLNRAADAAGFNYWVSELTYMRQSAIDVARGFFQSTEFAGVFATASKTDIVKIYYKTFLDREPEPAGLNYWINELNNGMNAVQMAEQFVYSNEFKAKCSSMGIILSMPSFAPEYYSTVPGSTPATNPNGTVIDKTVKAYTISTKTGTASISGYYDTEFAYQVFVLLNEYRKANGVGELTWSADMLIGTDIRSVETVYSFSHTRPNGQDCFSVTNGNLMRGENIVAASSATPESFFNAWKSSPGHNQNMLNPNWKTVSISVFVADSNDPYAKATQLFCYGVQSFGK